MLLRIPVAIQPRRQFYRPAVGSGAWSEERPTRANLDLLEAVLNLKFVKLTVVESWYWNGCHLAGKSIAGPCEDSDATCSRRSRESEVR